MFILTGVSPSHNAEKPHVKSSPNQYDFLYYPRFEPSPPTQRIFDCFSETQRFPNVVRVGGRKVQVDVLVSGKMSDVKCVLSVNRTLATITTFIRPPIFTFQLWQTPCKRQLKYQFHWIRNFARSLRTRATTAWFWTAWFCPKTRRPFCAPKDSPQGHPALSGFGVLFSKLWIRTFCRQNPLGPSGVAPFWRAFLKASNPNLPQKIP